MIDLVPLGEWAFLARFENEDEAASWARAVARKSLHGVVDVVTAYKTAAVYLDRENAALESVEQAIRSLACDEVASAEGRLITIPVLYDGADLEEVASGRGLTVEQVVAAHAGTDYRVFALGFLPGFPYCGYLPAELAGLPRLRSPRVQVEPGSVAVVGRQTGIYPQVSPGGWHLLGRTPCKIVDLETAYFPIRAGDRIRFEPIDAAAFYEMRGQDLGEWR